MFQVDDFGFDSSYFFGRSVFFRIFISLSLSCPFTWFIRLVSILIHIVFGISSQRQYYILELDRKSVPKKCIYL